MGEHLEVSWPRARAWLESVRRAAARVEPTHREIAALVAAREEVCEWRLRGSGGGHGAGAHSDPTAAEAERRICELDDLIADRRARLIVLEDEVGSALAVLARMARSLGRWHADALELYYVDLAPTWSDVACEMGVSRTRLWQLRTEAYAWVESNCRGNFAPE